jgi:hypothetical protein
MSTTFNTKPNLSQAHKLILNIPSDMSSLGSATFTSDIMQNKLVCFINNVNCLCEFTSAT